MNYFFRAFCTLALAASATATQAQTGTVAFSASSFSVNDTDAVGIVTINFTGSSNTAATVDFSTTNGTATAGQDYTETLLTIDLSSVTTSTNISIPILITNSISSDRTINLALSNPTGSAVLGSQSNALLTIVATGGTAAPVLRVLPVSLKALFISQETNQVIKLGFANGGLTSDRLVLILDPADHALKLGTVDSQNVVTYLATSTQAAFLSDGEFGGSLAFDSLVITNARFSATGTATWQLKGSFIIGKGGNAKLKQVILLGVFSGSFNESAEDVDGLIRGNMLSDGIELNPDNLDLP